MKKTKITYWVTTVLLAIMLIPEIFLINSPQTVAGYVSLGIPEWLKNQIVIAKFLGGIAILLPVMGSGLIRKISTNLKEWAYIGVGFDFISAFIAIVSVGGFILPALLPIVTLAILVLSYRSYKRLQQVRS